MPDILTPEELDAIARYRGPIQVIPRGVSGIDPTVVDDWRVQVNRSYRNRDDARKRAAMKMAETQRRNREAKKAALPKMFVGFGEPRELAMARFHNDGWSWSDIGAFFGITATNAYRYCKKRGLA